MSVSKITSPSTAPSASAPAKPVAAQPKFSFGAVIVPQQVATLPVDTFSGALPKAAAAANEEAKQYPSVQAARASMVENRPANNTSRFAGQFLGFAPATKSDSGLAKDQTVQGFGSDTGSGGGGDNQKG